MTTYNYILDKIARRGAAFLVLIDPDKHNDGSVTGFAEKCAAAGVDGFLVGGSLMMSRNHEEAIKEIKNLTHLPVIIFPGSINQVSPYADAILYLSLISGRNPEHLIGKHVLAAPLIKNYGIEPISTGYMLVESGVKTTAEYISGSAPIPRNKPEIAAATALAAEYIGMKLLYLEAGSGAIQHVPFEMVQAVSEYCTVPLIAGGGIRTPQTAERMVESGAKVVVVGNHFEKVSDAALIKEFSDAVHTKDPKTV
ncbi:MAG: geranylgeranylglyceryl/heptaprenylglyceryl phosphate synthase [Ignavibacteriaceae bacterium]|nr:geranylgeranylglyceryl/heptaprenylglyceryl phosphate synthase [Ignavibacteriaceae bacterium]